MFFFSFFGLQVSELESQSSQTNVIKSQKTELNQTIEELECTLKAKEEVLFVMLYGHDITNMPDAYMPFKTAFLLVFHRKW